MPNRFPTEAANADILGEGPGTPKGLPQRPPRSFSSDGLPRGRAAAAPHSVPGKESGAGTDINQSELSKD